MIWKSLFVLFLLHPVSLLAVMSAGCGVLKSLILVFLLDLSYFLPLFISIAFYRLFFHALCKFPGPFWARLSMFWRIKQMLSQDHYVLIDGLHKEYGDVVRIGPRHLSVNGVSGFLSIYGAGSKCGRAQAYDASPSPGGRSILNDRIVERHHKRRPAWDKALNSRTNMEYESRLLSLVNLLVSKFSDYDGTPVEVTNWFRCFVYDVMGAIGFNKTFGSVENGKLYSGIREMGKLQWFGTFVAQIPWLICTLDKIPGLGDPATELRNFCAQGLRDRTKLVPDVMSCVSSGKFKLTEGDIVEDALVLQIAGGVTTLSTLVNAVYHLATEQEIQNDLRKEIENAIPLGQSLRFSHIGELPFLEGFIREVLRMHPPIPSGPVRETPPEGLRVNDVDIPGNIVVNCPTWTIHHDPRNFPKPNAFLPTRWLPSSPDAPYDRRAFIPFSTGPFSCVGRTFAMMEMKTTIARIIETFDVQFAPGQDGNEFLRNSREQVVLEPGELRICFVARGK